MANLIARIKSRLRENPDPAPRERIVIYTAVTGSYDPLRPPQVIKPYFDYVAYVDDPDFPVPYPWQRRPISVSERSPRVTARYYKLHPHLLFPEYQMSVYIDASLVIRSDFYNLIMKSMRDHDIAQFPHPHRDCIYEEAKAVLHAKMDSEEAVIEQMRKYRAEGYPRHNGLFASGLMIRAHHAPLVIKVMEEWWQEIQMHSHRDQLSQPVVLWRNGLACYPIRDNIFSNKYVVQVRNKKP